MTLTAQQRRRYLKWRQMGCGAKVAWMQAQDYTPKLPEELDWLRGVRPADDESWSGTYKGLDAKVTVRSDEFSHLGDDDVTGTFTDAFEEGCIRNTVSRDFRACRWYKPSNYDREYAEQEIRAAGVPRGLVPLKLRERLERAMRDDADREYYGVTVTLSVDGDELASGSLWGIDCIGNDLYDPEPYLIQVATELLDEAFEEAKERAWAVLAKKEARVGELRRLAEEWQAEVVGDLTAIKEGLE